MCIFSNRHVRLEMCSKQLNGAARGQIGNGDLEKKRVIWARYVSVCSQHEVSVESGVHEFAFGCMCVEKREGCWVFGSTNI